jgi:hypothetical protein
MSITLRPSGPEEHLGDKASALVDGALDPREHERLLGHVALCPACRSVVDREREAKAFVARLAQPEMGVALTAALLTVPGFVDGDPAAPVAPVLEPLTASSGLPVAGPAARAGRSSARALVALSGVSATAAAVLIVGVTTAPATGLVAAEGISGAAVQRPVVAVTANASAGPGQAGGTGGALPGSVSDPTVWPTVRPVFSLVSGSGGPLRGVAAPTESLARRAVPMPMVAPAGTTVSGVPTAFTAAAKPAPSPPWVQPLAVDLTSASGSLP